MARSRRVALSWALVALQVVLFLAVVGGALATRVGPRIPSSWPGASILIALGAALLFWASANLGRALTPLPLPNGAGLTARGAYRWIRHPIYTAVLLTCLGIAVGAGTTLAYVAVARSRDLLRGQDAPRGELARRDVRRVRGLRGAHG